MILNVLAASLLGIAGAQILHETCHGLAALLTGARWEALHLFAVLWSDSPGSLATLVIEGSPALVNIGAGVSGAMLFKKGFFLRHPMFRLFLMYFGACSLFMGFGYLLVDPLFYRPDTLHIGDWMKVTDILGGSWMLRAPLILSGSAGVLWGFFFLARAAHRYMDVGGKSRVSVGFSLLLLPYILWSSVFTLLALRHPLGTPGTVATAMQYWLGYIGFFWAFFLAGYWLEPKTRESPVCAVPRRVSIPWALGAAGTLAGTLALTTPITF